MDLNNPWWDESEPESDLSLPLLTLGKAQYFKDETEDDVINGFISNSLSIASIKNENEEDEFWSTHDSTEYIDWSKTKRVVFPNLKPSTKTITIRVTESLLNALKAIANKKDVPYQSLVKIFLDEKVKEEFESQVKRVP